LNLHNNITDAGLMNEPWHMPCIVMLGSQLRGRPTFA